MRKKLVHLVRNFRNLIKSTKWSQLSNSKEETLEMVIMDGKRTWVLDNLAKADNMEESKDKHCKKTLKLQEGR